MTLKNTNKKNVLGEIKLRLKFLNNRTMKSGKKSMSNYDP